MIKTKDSISRKFAIQSSKKATIQLANLKMINTTTNIAKQINVISV
jgi:hypothetical protein